MTRNITAMRAAGASGGLVVDDIMRSLDARIPQMRMNCVRLPLTVMHAAVNLYRREHPSPGAT